MNLIRDFYKVPKSSPMPATHGLAEMLPFLLPKPNGALLDIGCFDGIKTALIGSAVGCTELFGVDFLVERLAEAAARGIHTGEVDLNSGQPLQFAPATFDVIICSEVIEHVYSPDDLLDEIARLLKPKGYAILTTPNLASW